MANTPNQSNGNGSSSFAGMATMPAETNLNKDYLSFNSATAKPEIEAMKQRIESLKAGLSILPYAQKVAELEAEFYKKLAELRKAVIRREITKKKAESDLRVSLQALGIAMDKIMGGEADRKAEMLSRANQWKQKAQEKRSPVTFPARQYQPQAQRR
jgi:hypothetical protein